jgi:short subunit dehydrogenase-like uncharacterized protein
VADPPERDLDLVLWGATGYTGRLVAHHLVRHGKDLRWALGGRNREKLETLRAELDALRPGAAELPLLVGDGLDPRSLEPIVARTRVICTTVGPYARYGTPLVSLCAELGTDCCDLSGEVSWMRRNVDRFHDRAKRSGARIVHCCGVDSIPSDLGVLLLHHTLALAGGRLARARFRVRSFRGKMSGGTAASLFEIVREARTDPAARKVMLDPYALNPPGEREGPDRDSGTRPRLDRDRGVWTAPFLMATINTRVVRRSNALLGFPYGQDFRYDERVDTGRGLRGRLRAHTLGWGVAGLSAAAALGPTAWLLRRFVLPDPGEGPSAAERERGGFRITILGEGVREFEEAPSLRARVKISADLDPGYGASARMLAESALCLARGEAEGLEAGILTPASALGLPLIERLRPVGITFEADRSSMLHRPFSGRS